MNARRLLTVVVPILSLALLVPAAANAYWVGYLLITDDQNDPIEGPYITPDALPNAMYATEFHHLVLTDEGTTAPYQKPLVVTKRVDRTSSRLVQAFVNDEHLTVILKVYEDNQLRYEFELEHARIVAMEPISETSDPVEGQEYEKLRFMYSRITVRDIAEGTAVVWTLAGWPI